MKLKLSSLKWDAPVAHPLVQKMVFDGYEFGIKFSPFPGINLILKEKPYAGRYVHQRENPYYQYWRFDRQAIYDHGKQLVEHLVDAGAGSVVADVDGFFEKIGDARINVAPGAFVQGLRVTIYQLEGGGVVAVGPYHQGIIAVCKAMYGRWLPPMKGWKMLDASALMLKQNLVDALHLLEDQVTIAAGAYGIVDDQFAPSNNAGATIKVLASDIPERLNADDDSSSELYLAVTSPRRRTLISEEALAELISEYDLYDFQRTGVRHLVVNSSSLLADDMGLGKTRQAIVAADIASNLYEAPGRVLAVAPASLLINWSREVIAVIPGDKSFSINKYDPDRKWTIVSYDMLESMVRYADRFRVMTIDEAQLLKEATSQRTRFAFDIAAKVPHRSLLTGTPILNREREIHSLLRLSGHPVGQVSLREFEAQYAGDPELRSHLHRLISEWMLRRTKDQVLKHLKGKKRQALYLEITAEERRRYDAINADRSILTLPKITMLRRTLEGFKVASIVRMVAELNPDDKVLLFCEFKDTVEAFKEAFKALDIGFQVLTGDMSVGRRQKSVDAFQDDPLSRVFITITTAGGVGWNLTAANYVFLVSLPWTPALAAQAEDRAYRNGQLRLVISKIPLVPDTIDLDLVEMHRSKRATAAEIVEPEEAERLAAEEFAEGFYRHAA